MTRMSLEQALALGKAKHQQGELREAQSIYEQILRAFPDQPEALHLSGLAAFQEGRLDVAVTFLRKAIGLVPNAPHFHLNLGHVYSAQSVFPEAIAEYQHALALQPTFVEALKSLGNLLREQGEIDPSVDLLTRAVSAKPGSAELLNCLGTSLRQQGKFEEAIHRFRQAIVIDPQLAAAHHNLGLMLLQQGDESTGWREFEWRWKVPEYAKIYPQFPTPRWNGEDLRGRRILLHCEQGFGDTIQFVRYAKQVADRGGEVILLCQPELAKLLKSAPGVSQLITDGDRLPGFDFHSPLMSLPGILGTEDTSASPYLTIPQMDIDRWRAKLGSNKSRRIGLVWAGHRGHRMDWNRSIPLQQLQPLKCVANASFYNLQLGDAYRQASEFPLIDFTSELHDFAETAALIQNLDLVITVDTAVAHLAGAMGKRVWVLLPFVPDWRWRLNRDDSIWYPTMRLFRQSTRGDWSQPIERLANALAKNEDA